jgi:hypothetical protein
VSEPIRRDLKQTLHVSLGMAGMIVNHLRLNRWAILGTTSVDDAGQPVNIG